MSAARGLVAGLLLACAPAALRAQADSVKLSFAWPAGLEANVTHRALTVERQGDAKAESTAVTASWRMRVRQHPSGVLVDYYDFKFPGTDSSNAQAISMAALGGAVVPSVVVGPRGDLVGLADEEAFVATLRRMIQPIIDQLPHEAEGARDLLQRFLDPAVLRQQAVTDWTGLVGAWLDATMHLQVPLELTTEEPIPLFPGRTVPYHTYYEFVSREPCAEGARDSACVGLVMTSLPDTAAMAALITEVMQGMLRGLREVQGPLVRGVDVYYQVQVVTEPRTLVPHWAQFTQRVTARMEIPGEGVTGMSRERRRTFDFVYAPPR